MDLYGLIADTLFCLFISVFFVAFVWLFGQLRRENMTVINDLLERHRDERKDLVDRLMARDLTEVKQAQTIEPIQPRVVSKRQNDDKLRDEARKLVERNDWHGKTSWF